MGAGNEWLWLLVIASLAILFLPQWLTRRKRVKKVAAFEPGDRVMTVGGFLGTLTYINLEENVARLRLGEGMEVEMIPVAISRKVETPDGVVERNED